MRVTGGGGPGSRTAQRVEAAGQSAIEIENAKREAVQGRQAEQQQAGRASEQQQRSAGAVQAHELQQVKTGLTGFPYDDRRVVAPEWF